MEFPADGLSGDQKAVLECLHGHFISSPEAEARQTQDATLHSLVQSTNKRRRLTSEIVVDPGLTLSSIDSQDENEVQGGHVDTSAESGKKTKPSVLPGGFIVIRILISLTH